MKERYVHFHEELSPWSAVNVALSACCGCDIPTSSPLLSSVDKRETPDEKHTNALLQHNLLLHQVLQDLSACHEEGSLQSGLPPVHMVSRYA